MKMTRWWFSIVVWACASCSDRAVVGTDGGSPETTTDRGSYLGLKAPTSGAVVFAPGLVSRPGRYEYAMSIHPAGDRLLFTVEDPKEGASVHESRIRNGAWTTPQPVDLTGGDWSNEMEAFFSADGERVFFAPFCKGMDVRIWSADVTPTGFANPRPLGGPIARDPSFFPVQAEDGTLYYTNLAHRAVYRATLDNDEVTMVEPAGLELGGHAYPAPDGSFIVLDSASTPRTNGTSSSLFATMTEAGRLPGPSGRASTPSIPKPVRPSPRMGSFSSSAATTSPAICPTSTGSAAT